MYKNKKDKKSLFKTIDKHFLIGVLVLTSFGIIAIADASAPIASRNFSDKLFFARQQFYFALIGFFLLIVASNINYKIWQRFGPLLFLLNLFFLFLILIPGFGISALGAKRRIDLGFFSFQPSEFLKITLSMYIAKVAEKGKGIFSYLLPLLISAFLIVLQPDLGTALIIVGIGLTQMFVAGINLFQFFILVLGGGGITTLLILFSDYRKERLLTFLEQTRDPLGKSYHIRQILLALGSGGFWGVGLGNSKQKYLFLPETATDSIFAVLAEEFGFMGSVVIILIFSYFIYRGYKIIVDAPDTFSRIFSLGIISWIGGQTILNIAAMSALVPLTGVPIPFISYGGSSLVSLLFACGILLNISKYGKKIR